MTDHLTSGNHELSSEARKAFADLFRKTPVIALHGGGMSRTATTPQTVDDVRVNLAKIIDTLKYYMGREDALSTELADLHRDLKAAGRVLKLMTDDASSEDRRG